MRKRILDQPIDILNIDEASHMVKMALVHPRQCKIITLNPEMVVNASRNFEFQAAINNSHLVIPDGTGIVWALKSYGFKNAIRIPGIELAEQILEIANGLSKKVAIFGGKKEVLEKAVNAMTTKYPNINFVKAIDGYQKEDNEVAHSIASCKPDVVLVALGTPRQEIWIDKYASLFPHSIMIGIGGSLDVWSGKKKRAPEWIRNMYLEWLFRVITDPQRIPRVIRSLPLFIYMVLKEKLREQCIV